VLVLLIDAGACVAQLAVLHMDWIHTVVIGALLLLLIYLQREQLAGALAIGSRGTRQTA
jgi:hypothetical protein